MYNKLSQILKIFFIIAYFWAPFWISAIFAGWLLNPSIEKAEKFVYANGIGSSILADSSASVCIDEGFFYSNYYIKSSGKIYYCGYGSFGFLMISNEKIKEEYSTIFLDKCSKIKK
jgi:hypothetical protein